MLSKILATSWRMLPVAALSRFYGRFCRTSFSRVLIRPCVRFYHIAVQEAEFGLSEYPTWQAFFTRRLKPGLRPIDPDPEAVVSPVDAEVAQVGRCERDRLFHVKGSRFGLPDLLVDDDLSRRFRNGSYIILRLYPGDYHRVHAPVDLSCRALTHIPGRLLMIGTRTLNWFPGLYSQSERVVVQAATAFGDLAMVLVGASGVGSIRLNFTSLATNRPGAGIHTVRFEKPAACPKGEELGRFELGSSLILLFEPGRIRWETAAPGRRFRLGERIAIRARE